MEDGGNHRLKKEWKICTALPAVTINPIAFTAKLRLSGQTERYFSIYKRAHGCVAGRRIVQRFVLLATRLLVTCNWKFILAHVHTVAHTAPRWTRLYQGRALCHDCAWKLISPFILSAHPANPFTPATCLFV